MKTDKGSALETIRKERLRKQRYTREDLLVRVLSGDYQEATGDLVFHTDPEVFVDRLHWILESMEGLDWGHSEHE
jgi:hypothetical protein